MREEKLIKNRKKAGLSQQEAADLLGVSRQVLSAVENGRYDLCSTDTIIKIKKFMENYNEDNK